MLTLIVGLKFHLSQLNKAFAVGSFWVGNDFTQNCLNPMHYIRLKEKLLTVKQPLACMTCLASWLCTNDQILLQTLHYSIHGASSSMNHGLFYRLLHTTHHYQSRHCLHCCVMNLLLLTVQLYSMAWAINARRCLLVVESKLKECRKLQAVVDDLLAKHSKVELAHEYSLQLFRQTRVSKHGLNIFICLHWLVFVIRLTNSSWSPFIMSVHRNSGSTITIRHYTIKATRDIHCEEACN